MRADQGSIRLSSAALAWCDSATKSSLTRRRPQPKVRLVLAHSHPIPSASPQGGEGGRERKDPTAGLVEPPSGPIWGRYFWTRPGCISVSGDRDCGRGGSAHSDSMDR